MSIETLIENHTKALEGLTAAILGLQKLPKAGGIQEAYAAVIVPAPVPEATPEVVPEPVPAKKAKKPVAEAPKEEPVEDLPPSAPEAAPYSEVRQMVSDKATAKGKQIRGVFDLHGIGNLRELLNDPTDMESGVKDPQKLADIYEALKVL